MQPLRRRALLAAFTVAALDGVFAVTLCRVRNAACTPGGVFRSIASAVLGPSARQGGLGGALAGVGVHLLVASAWTVLFLMMYVRSPALRRLTAGIGGRVLAAVCYGAGDLADHGLGPHSALWRQGDAALVSFLLVHPRRASALRWIANCHAGAHARRAERLTMTLGVRGKPPIVFVHGLWLHAETWNPWIEHFRALGYDATAASWPGDGQNTMATRMNPGAVAGFGVSEIANHIAAQIRHLPKRPILIGHSFGGLLVQKLLGRNLASAAVAIDPAPMKGVLVLPFSSLKASFAVLRNPLHFSMAISLTEKQFRYGFTNAVSEQEAHELYGRYAMPGPARPLFQAATANVLPGQATAVDVTNATRGPLLLVAGARDHTVPPAVVRSTFKRYRKSPAITEYREFEGRGHSLTIDRGWREIAEYVAGWLEQHLP